MEYGGSAGQLVSARLVAAVGIDGLRMAQPAGAAGTSSFLLPLPWMLIVGAMLPSRPRMCLGARLPQRFVHWVLRLPAALPRPRLILCVVPGFRRAALGARAPILHQSPMAIYVAIVPSLLLDLVLCWMRWGLRLGEDLRSALTDVRALGSFFVDGAPMPILAGRPTTATPSASTSTSTAAPAAPREGPWGPPHDVSSRPRATRRSTVVSFGRRPMVGECGLRALARQGGVSILDVVWPPMRATAPALRFRTAGTMTPSPPWGFRAGRPRLPAWSSTGTCTCSSPAWAWASSQLGRTRRRRRNERKEMQRRRMRQQGQRRRGRGGFTMMAVNPMRRGDVDAVDFFSRSGSALAPTPPPRRSSAKG